MARTGVILTDELRAYLLRKISIVSSDSMLEAVGRGPSSHARGYWDGYRSACEELLNRLALLDCGVISDRNGGDAV